MPDIKKRFFDSLKRGTGEAYILASDNPAIDFSAYIIKGALKNYAYDGQSEPSRAQYIVDLMAVCDKKEKIRKAVLKGLATEQNDTWSLTHLFDLAKLLAQQGDQQARQAIYDRFLNHPIEKSDWVGHEEILELDGLQGLFYVAEKFGKAIEKNPDDWQDGSIIRGFQEDNPKIEVEKELEIAAHTNTYIRLYLDNIRATEEGWKKYTSEPPEYKNILDEVIHSQPYLAHKRKKSLNAIELNTIADALLVEKEVSTKEKLLNVFTSHRFPLDHEFILKLAMQRPSSQNRVNEFAIKALKYLKSKHIREFALSKLSKTKHPEVFVAILVSNYEPGDSKLLTEMADKAKNESVIERLASSYVDIFTANPTKECTEPLEMLYNKMNCGIHRNYIVKLLIENDVLSDRLKKEIKKDSYLYTRELLNQKSDL